MLICKKCKGNVLLDLSKVYIIKGIPVISGGKVSASSVVFSYNKSNPEFVCSSCGKVDETSVLIMCRECGDYFPKEELNTSSYGSTVCNNCVKKYELENVSKFELKIIVE